MNTRTTYASTAAPALPASRTAIHLGSLALQGVVALTAVVGGIFLVVGALLPETTTVMNPATDYLANTPFSSYLLPGLLLAVVLGGVHAAAFVLETTRNRWRLLIATAAATALMIWIFVQMIYIPFSFLQLLYFTIGLAEIGLVMLALGITRPLPSSARPH